MPRLRYRLGQGLRAWLAALKRPDLTAARPMLSDCEYAAFCRLSRADQLHSLRVLQAVLSADADAPKSLQKAALLHDIGKSRYRLAVWQKTAAVLVKSLAPGWFRRLSAGDSLAIWRAPFRVHAQHPRWSGEILRACGTGEAVLWLVEHHQCDTDRLGSQPLHEQLLALQRADDRS
ncbi:MAG: HD domain-containing protein [Chloroflexi bacterium]|nr:HD domain-containing protein [Chloroflexota bacterium]MCY3583490.1 HD domain-containing protein [Chloroflexota bacterium]MCY3715722.1 HD domain-containing protein [Chloroflexota bacterium]MDE2649890.1 HD domain-containing protein [Chloroflexota bacterium]MXV93044.1 HD domain-containing protein [Chloroflexota bacterium]